MKIVKRSLLTFLKGLKYYFTPLGTMMLFFIIGLCVAIPNSVAAVTHMIEEISRILGGMTFDWEAATQAMIGDVMGIGWTDDFMASLNQLINADFLKQLMHDAINAAFGEINYFELIANAVEQCVAEILMQVVLWIVLTVIGLIVGFILTRMLLRHEVASVGTHFGRFMIRIVLDAVLFVILITLIFAIIGALDSAAAWLAIVGAVILYAALSIFKSYLIYGLKKVPLKTVLHPLHLLYLLLGDVIVIGICVGVVILCYYTISTLITIILAIPLAMILIIAIDLSTESYVAGLAIEEKAKLVEQKA